MGLLGSILGGVVDGAKDLSEAKYVQELLPKMKNSAIANDFENWFRAQLEDHPFLYSQYNFYDECDRLVAVDDDGVMVCFEIARAEVSDGVACNFANTLGYMPLSANGLTCSNGKPASERVLIKAFAEVVKERVQKVLTGLPGEFRFGDMEFDDGTDQNADYLDRVVQRANSAAFGGDAKLHVMAGFTYYVPKQAQRSAF